MDGRWRGGGDGDGDDLPSNPHPGKVPEEELLLPEIGFAEAAALWNSPGKYDLISVVSTLCHCCNLLCLMLVT